MKKLAIILGLAGIMATGVSQANADTLLPGRHKMERNRGNYRTSRGDGHGRRAFANRDDRGDRMRRERRGNY